MDVFGQVITTQFGVPPLKKQPECTCPNCQRNLAASRFAPHLEKCMGMGRNSSRLASRRLATSGKDNYRESGKIVFLKGINTREMKFRQFHEKNYSQ